MGNKYFRTKCYWFNEYQDMNAIIPTCNYYGQYGSCSCSDECEHYISEQEVDSIIRKGVEDEWIPVSEKLPNTNGIYIVTRRKSDGFECRNRTNVCYFDGTSTWHDDALNERKCLADVLAWMPLPNPYREDGET